MSGRGEAPWLERELWSGGVVRSRAPTSLFGHWFGAAVWWLLTVPLVIAFLNGDLADVPPLIRILLVIFAAAAIPVTVGAVMATIRERRFRDLELELDPFPGSPGGQVGGEVRLPIRPAALEARAELMCLRRYLRRTSDGTERREEAIWRAEVEPEVVPDPAGSRVRFVFDVPADEGLPETEPESDDHHRWIVRLAASVPGPDLDRVFEVPVYSVDPPLRSSLSPTVPAPDAYRELRARGIRVDPGRRDLRIRYGFGRYGGVAPLLLVFGAVFVIAGLAAGRGAGELSALIGGIFLTVFAGVGGLILLVGLYLLGNRLTVTVGGGRVVSRRLLLVLPLTREVSTDQIERLESSVTVKRGRGASAVPYYTIRASLAGGGGITLGDGIRGTYLKDRIVERLEEALGLDSPDEPRSGADDIAPAE